MKKTIEIEDSREEREGWVRDEIRNDFIEYLSENPAMVDWDEYYQAQGADAVSEAADSNTPIYYSDIDALHYLYGNELQDAYNNAGIGDGKEDNHKQVAIYCLLSEHGHEFLNTLQAWFEGDYTEYVESLTGENGSAEDHAAALKEYIAANAPKQ